VHRKDECGPLVGGLQVVMTLHVRYGQFHVVPCQYPTELVGLGVGGTMCVD